MYDSITNFSIKKRATGNLISSGVENQVENDFIDSVFIYTYTMKQQTTVLLFQWLFFMLFLRGTQHKDISAMRV